MENSNQNEGSMEITQTIISEQIVKLNEHYRKLEELLKNATLKSNLIKTTIDNLKSLDKSKIYPDIKSHYKELHGYGNKTIYLFFVDEFPYDKTQIEEKVKNAKDNNISLPRRNENSPWWEKRNETPCLYVGSSEKITDRLKEHFFLCNQGSYAMHLEAWFPHDLQITIHLWDFSKLLKSDNDENFEYLQNIEDLLWNHYQPLLGRQGKK